MIDVYTSNPGAVIRLTPEEKALTDLRNAIYAQDPVEQTRFAELDALTALYSSRTPEQEARFQILTAEENQYAVTAEQKAQEFYANPAVFTPFLEARETEAFLKAFSMPKTWVQRYYRGKYNARPTFEEFTAMAPELQEILKKKAFDMAVGYLVDFNFTDPDLKYFLQYLTPEKVKEALTLGVKHWIDDPVKGSQLNPDVAVMLGYLPAEEQAPYLQKWVHNYANRKFSEPGRQVDTRMSVPYAKIITLPELNVILRAIGQPSIIVSESGMYDITEGQNARNLTGVVTGSIHGEALGSYLASDWNKMVRDMMNQLGLADFYPCHEIVSNIRVPLSDIYSEMQSSGRGGLESANYRNWSDNTGMPELGLYYDENQSNPNYEKNAKFYGQLRVVVIIVIVIIVAYITAGLATSLLGGLLGSSGAYLASAGGAYVANQARTQVSAGLIGMSTPDLDNLPSIRAVEFVAPGVNPNPPAPVKPEDTASKPGSGGPSLPGTTTPPGTTPLETMMAGFDLSALKNIAPAIATLVIFGFIFSNVGVGSIVKIAK